MKTVSFWVFGLLVAANVAMAAQTSRDPVSVTAELEGKLESRHTKVGDRVVLRAAGALKAGDGSAIPRGAKLMGHVTQIRGHDRNNADAQVAILIDRAQWKRGKSVPVHVQIESVQPVPEAPGAFGLNAPLVGGWGKTPQSGSSGSGPAVSTTRSSTTPAAAPVADGVAQTEGETDVGEPGKTGINEEMATHLDVSTEETFVGRSTGIPGVFVSSDASAASSGMIFAKNKDLRLDSGTIFTLRTVNPSPGK